MLKKFPYICLLLPLVLINTSLGHEDTARLRFMQLSFVTQGSATVDVQLNGVTIFESLSFPLAADLVITLESGHRYSVIVEGDYRGGEVSFILIDGTELIPQQVKSGAIVVNFPSDALDVVINNEGMTADIASGHAMR